MARLPAGVRKRADGTLEKRFTVNKEPFLSSNKKVFQRINDVPGPGAYYHDEVLIQYLKNIQNEKISEQNDKVHLIAKGGNIDLLPNSEKIGFNIKSYSPITVLSPVEVCDDKRTFIHFILSPPSVLTFLWK